MAKVKDNSKHRPSTDLYDRYLDILGVSRRQPSYSALTELVYAHMTRIPFENLSKIYRMRTINLHDLPGLELYLDGIERHNFGGTCYTSNNYFYMLLNHLNYDVRLCGADMSNPNAHLTIMASVEGHEYLIDTGYAAPFLHPLPRDSADDHIVQLGRDRYVLHPQDEDGCSRLDLFRDDNLRHGYLAKPASRKIEDFARQIANSFNDDSTFINSLLMVRFYSNYSITINNFTMIHSQNTTSQITEFDNRDDLTQQIVDIFGIPHDIVQDVVSGLNPQKSAWD